jgi:ubiquinone/menaquinone biosynthesis C-methylase UbiE
MSPAPADHYVGTELELFAGATRWKNYFASKIRPHLGADVAEVGAGIGGTTALLASGHGGRWVCLEPDQRLLTNIQAAITSGGLPTGCEARAATLSDLPATERFDSILYIDVLEHIEDDHGEVRRAALHLRRGGKLIVLGPAHQWLYSPFDRAIGHFRRYTRSSLAATVPRDLRRIELSYLDSVGLLASAGNRFISRSSSPTAAQIKLWDRGMIPLSRVMDPLTRYSLGKSVFGVWQKA